MHTVLSDDCTGCDLCVSPCPVDCIEMVNVAPAREWTRNDADLARSRYERRQLRLNKTPASLRTSEHSDTSEDSLTQATDRPPLWQSTATEKQTAVQAALARARARRNSTAP
jgi:electron transport complex protein RnfB